MRFYFTSNNLIGSRLIRWGLDDDCSHFAESFFDDTLGDYAIVVQSNMQHGFFLEWKKDFLSKNRVVHCLKPKRDLSDKEHKIYKKVSSKLHGLEYDFKGICYWFFLGLIYKLGFITKDQMDNKTNRWADRSAVFCSEVLSAHSDFLVKHGFDSSYLKRQNLRPHKAYELLLATDLFEECSKD